MSKALVILSGGQDSVTCLGWALENYEEVACVTFDYGQRHFAEITAARQSVQHFQHKTGREIPHEIIELGDGIFAGTSFLTDKEQEVETFANADEMTKHNAYKDNKLDKSFVPMRNALFLTLAANRAYVAECNALVTGVTAADYAEFGGLSWEWLGGFADAEGCFNVVNGNGWRFSISQKDPDLIYRVQAWITEQVPGVLSSVYLRKKDGCAELCIGKKSMPLVLPFLSPHLHSPYRRYQAERMGAILEEEQPLNDAYVAGFWEGDGSCYGKIGPTRCGGRFDSQFSVYDVPKRSRSFRKN